MADPAAADRPEAPHRRVVLARPAGEGEVALERISWPATALRLALEPRQHPWRQGWRLRRRARERRLR